MEKEAPHPYAISRAGHPPKYKTPADLQVACDNYFKWIEGEYEPKVHGAGSDSEWTEQICIRLPERPMITGLVLFLGFVSRQSLTDYQDRPPRGNKGFSDVIKRARSRVEMAYEAALSGTTPTGSIFALKNMGWQDKTVIDNNMNGSLSLKFETDGANEPLPD